MNLTRVGLGLTLASLLLAGCGSGGSEPQADSPEAPKAPDASAKLSGELKVAAFKGGYDTDFYQAAADEFQKLHPDLKIEVTGNPRIWEQLRPQFVSGSPPDLVFPGWGMDHWGLVQEGQLFALDSALDGKSFDGSKTWRETFTPGLLELGQQDGKTYMLPYYVMVYGWWYDANVFEKHGWKAPGTWDELLTLCADMKAKGVAPITFQGQYPYYMAEGMLLPWCLSVGGKEAVAAAQNLEPGAWKSESMVRAATMIDELNAKGFLQKGAVGMSHTESQMEFLLGKAAMIPSGSWLASEMSKQMASMNPKPKLRFFLPPVVAGGKGDASALLIGIEPWMVPSKAKNPEAALAFYKFMTSVDKAKQFVEQKGTLMSIQGSDEGVKLPEELVEAKNALNGAKTVWAVQYRSWYPDFQKELENALTALLNREITPQQFCDRVEAKAEALRKDDSIKKYKVAG